MLRLLTPYWPRLLMTLALTLLSAAAATWPPDLARQVIDQALPALNTSALLRLAGTMALALILKEALVAAHEYANAALGLRITGDVRRRLWQRIMHAPLSFFTHTPRGEILQRMLDDTEAVQRAATRAWPRLLYETAAAAAALVAMLRISPPLTLLGLSAVVLATLPARPAGAVSQRLSAQTRERQAAIYQQAQERLEAIRLVKSFTAEEREARLFRTNQLDWARLQLRSFLITQSFMNVARILDSLAPMLLYLAGGYQVFARRLTVGELVALVAYLPLLGAPVRSFSATYLSLKAAAPKLTAVLEWLNLPAEPGRNADRQPFVPEGDICFDCVTFTYPGSTEPVLRSASFRIPGGAHTALTGPSGAGKSTILSLLTRLYEPDSGRITIGGRRLSEIHPDDLRRQLGLVTQDVFLLNGSIRQNLTFGLEQPPSDEALRESLRQVGLGELVQTAPAGLEQPLGERGLKLSGGQRQRLALARAFLRRPRLLLLDEATAALDNESQALVHSAVAEQFAGCTVLTVAHRHSTIQSADFVLAVTGGTVTAVTP